MHRFRKKSDVGRPGEHLDSLRALESADPLPILPPVGDFRTSLILPDLSRRFTLLRKQTGDPYSLDELKERFADQRAKGLENQVTEEEEDMILETLGKLSSKRSAREGSGSGDSISDGTAGRQSVRSTTSQATPPSPASSTRPSKRYSNNLFGSGAFRDNSYLRGRGTSHRTGSRNNVSIASSDLGRGLDSSIWSDSVAESAGEDDHTSFSVPSTPNDPIKDFASNGLRSAPLNGSFASIAPIEPMSSFRMSRNFTMADMRRLSLSLDAAIAELEEEAEDEIVMERTTPAPRQPPHQIAEGHSESGSSTSGVGTALSADRPVHIMDVDSRGSPSRQSRSGATSPTRLPGYIPGMPRPVTPRDSNGDLGDASRPHSTTPRPISPPSFNDRRSPAPSNLPTRHDSYATRPSHPSISTSMSSTQMFYNRSTNGRFTPEGHRRQQSADSSASDSSPARDSRQTAASPLSRAAFPPFTIQPFTGSSASRPSTAGSSRPGTPSNITWRAPAADAASVTSGGHSRQGSWQSTTNSHAEVHAAYGGGLDRNQSLARSVRSPPLPDSPLMRARSLRSPALPDSPTLEGEPQSLVGAAAHAYVPAMELGSPVLPINRGLHSPTPTQATQALARQAASIGGVARAISPPVNGARGMLDTDIPASPFSLSFGPSHNPLSPAANSSRSSLESTGSSYHSEAGEGRRERIFDLLFDLEQQRGAWHDVTPGTSPDDAEDAEDVVQQYAALTKADFVAIQDKLVGAARAKEAPPGVDRPPSLRRRRPSVSQSSYSLNRVASPDRGASPAPQNQTQPPSRTTSPLPLNAEKMSKAKGLLDSVITDIESPRRHTEVLPEPAPTSAQPQQLSSPERRERALADALFGDGDFEFGLLSPTATSFSPLLDAGANGRTSPLPPSSHTTEAPGSSTDTDETASPTHLAFSPGSSSPAATVTPTVHVDLALEVQRRTDAAMAALRKSPSIPKFPDVPTVKKRINTSQISTPRLDYASTSVDTIPLRSPSAASGQAQMQASKKSVGQRIRNLRGTLRAKNLSLPQDDGAQEVFDISPLSARQEVFSPSIRLHPAPVSATTAEGPKPGPTGPSPPASAGPSRKGFMSRFRKQRPGEAAAAPPQERRPTPLPLATPSPSGLWIVPSSHEAQSAPAFGGGRFPGDSPVSPPAGMQFPPHSAAPAARGDERTFRSPSPPSPPAATTAEQPAAAAAERSTSPESEVALRQLFDAATNLGLDQGALNELIARSNSISSRSTAWTMLTRNNSTATSARSRRPETKEYNRGNGSQSPPGPSEGRPSIESTYPRSVGGFSPRSTVATEGLSLDFLTRAVASPDSAARLTQSPPLSPSTTSVRFERGRSPLEDEQPSFRHRSLRVPPPPDSRKSRDDPEARRTVVRRTLIFPSDLRASTLDFNSLSRKGSLKKSRRASAGSTMSGRSVHDRVPTPPPRTGGARRFSTDVPSGSAAPPPVPQLPASFSSPRPSDYLAVPASAPAGPLEHSTSAVDSLYDMYAGDAVPMAEPRNASMDDSTERPALEVIELANGETIWSIVNGLRDEGEDSFYGDRMSFASDYSLHDQSQEGVQLFFKEHARTGSKESNSSYLSRKSKKNLGAQRPETKVFYSSPAQIARLIEKMSQGLDAGSFNIMPTPSSPGPTHHSNARGESVSSSFHSEGSQHWSVEDRLEHMLGSINPAS